MKSKIYAKSRLAGSSIFVTGGAGYIGSHLVRILSKAGYSVTIYDNFSTGSRTNIPAGVETIEGDIRDLHTLDQALKAKSYHAVIHLAAKTSASESVTLPDLYKEVNHLGSSNVWQICKSITVPKILYASTAAVYGDLGSNNAQVSFATSPLSPYGSSKLGGETALFESCGKTSSCYALRLFNVGGGQDNRHLGEPTVLHAVKNAKMQKSPLTIYGQDHGTYDGTPVRDFVHVEDVANAFIHLLKNTASTGIYNVASGKGISIKELAELAGVPVTYGPRRSGDISYSVADIQKTVNAGWKVTRTLEEILT